jgi:topoisomerase IA-like protein
MDNNNSVVIGKINKKKCYLNNGKYGHYITYDTKNYKVPEWFPADKMDIDVAERLIEYKKKMSELWLDDTKKPKASKKEESSDDEDDTDEEVIIKPSKLKK